MLSYAASVCTASHSLKLKLCKVNKICMVVKILNFTFFSDNCNGRCLISLERSQIPTCHVSAVHINEINGSTAWNRSKSESESECLMVLIALGVKHSKDNRMLACFVTCHVFVCVFVVSSGSVTVNADSSVQLLAEEAVPLDQLDVAVSIMSA